MRNVICYLYVDIEEDIVRLSEQLFLREQKRKMQSLHKGYLNRKIKAKGEIQISLLLNCQLQNILFPYIMQI